MKEDIINIKEMGKQRSTDWRNQQIT